MMSDIKGQLVAIVGPSGVGKDTIMQTLKVQCPDIVLAKRIITRPGDAGGEDFIGVSQEEFMQRQSDGEFALEWTAHGLNYGVPAVIDDYLRIGRTVLFNGSRAALPAAEEKYPDLKVVMILASQETLEKRLTERGRESADDVQNRLSRANYKAPVGSNVVTISNDGELQVAVDQLKKVIRCKEETVQ
ncbi:phosphonate metabolism protein/1,5-bisphosphokinase (PRPP-forming) PhnN [Lentilitoribacter sp. Alg239-R112]|uniref:phosphonate metabolism protein/1,5-bisphosphokinase (PRPP-forming) PhnN n=2 Tax=unclassified Lentilitoribacter TaxID=2647570 RepID=UPI001AEE4046|nr:phosphonate metabolism protein/1,5-bisphosphokinase (PRPP-forming) PhnN [Lentilitoribacter sp. Alg239-R112]